MLQFVHEDLLAEYVTAFVRGQKPAQAIRGIQARVCRRKPGEPVRLSDDPARRIVFLIDYRVCHAMIGLTGYQIATTLLGWEPNYTKNKVRAGTQFDLVVFPEHTCKLGTWNNLLDLVELTYPEVGAKLRPHRAALAAMTPTALAELERQQGYTLGEVAERGAKDPRFMTVSRYIEAPDTVASARAFLYHVVYCRELFTGDGCTVDKHGNHGVPEYIMADEPLEKLGPHEIIPIHIEVP